MSITLNRFLGEAGAWIDESNGGDRLYLVLKELATVSNDQAAQFNQLILDHNAFGAEFNQLLTDHNTATDPDSTASAFVDTTATAVAESSIVIQ